MNRVSSLPVLLRCLLLAGLACATLPLAAQPAPAPLTLEECVRRAVAKNFDVQAERLTADNAREALVIARSGYDPALRASLTRSSLNDGSGVVGATTGRIGVSQRIITGATVDLSSAVDRSRGVAILNPVYNSDVTLAVTQPLLKGGGLATNRAVIDRARLGVDRAGHDLRATVMDVVRATEFAFHQLVFARRQLEVRRLSLAAAQRLYDENKAKRDIGVLTDLEVLTAEVSVATQRRNVLLAEQDLRDSEDELRALIGRFELDAPVPTPTSLEVGRDDTDVDTAFNRAKAGQPEYLAARAAVDQLRLDVVSARNNRLPEVDLSAAAGYNNAAGSLSSSLNDLPGSDRYSWQLGLSVSYPWMQRGDRARHRTAVNTLSRETLRLSKYEQDLLVQVRSAVRAVATNREAVDVAAMAAKLAEKQYELEKARFDAGQSTARRVLDAQTDLDDARVNEISSQVNLLNAQAALRRLEGLTLDRYGIQLAP